MRSPKICHQRLAGREVSYNTSYIPSTLPLKADTGRSLWPLHTAVASVLIPAIPGLGLRQQPVGILQERVVQGWGIPWRGVWLLLSCRCYRAACQRGHVVVFGIRISRHPQHRLHFGTAHIPVADIQHRDSSSRRDPMFGFPPHQSSNDKFSWTLFTPSALLHVQWGLALSSLRFFTNLSSSAMSCT